jgi:hypothetical protein
MSQSLYPPVKGERLLLLQPTTLDTLDDIGTMQNDITRRVHKAMQGGGGGSFLLARQLWVLRDFTEDSHVLLFNAGSGLFIGREVANAEGLKAYNKVHAHDAGNAHGTGKATRPGVYR